ncbi:hypothetical protein K435DRAFT_257331 [Dendrothele bispora CBS 962.96]|uniref:Uncharacterized protein n=1 Tax=Dendrothele bispora (strain CBS 962.96) TaxID=1314807 RepID=A0A4S8LMG3_DENBC|nr:hypothetical protein K435DRAFT_257331 [Dendrothele bispora CBS 962.96]
MAELNRLREDYEAKLKEKDETIEKERTTWDWVRKDLVERQRQEMDELKERLEAEIDVLRNDLQETQCSLNAGNEELQVARETLKQNGADEAANLVAIDAGIQRLKSGYEIRLLEKDKAIDELRKTHEKERQEWAQTLRDAEKQMELKEEGWQEEKQQLRTEHEHQREAFGYATQSNTNLIDKLRDDAFKTDALLDSRTKELEKTKSQLKKIQQKWKELQEKNRRTISSDTEQTPTSPQVKSFISGSDNPPKLGLPRVAQDLPLSTHTFPLSATLSGNMTYEDVKRLLDTLNSEIFQFAAQFTDDIDQLRRVPAEMGQSTELIEGERVEALKEMASLLGNNIVEYLNSEPEREDCDAVSQCALQAILLHWCKRVVNMWAWNKEVNNALKDIYEGILGTKTRQNAGGS